MTMRDDQFDREIDRKRWGILIHIPIELIMKLWKKIKRKSNIQVKYAFGWLKDKPDDRDFLYSMIRPRMVLPSSTDLRKQCPPIRNQQNLGSCTAQAATAVYEFCDRKDDLVFRIVSALFNYFCTRETIGTIYEDSGGYLRDAIKASQQTGICLESLWPYIPEKFTERPTAECYEDAEKHQVTAYYRLKSLEDMKVCLSEGYPFVCGILMYASAFSESVEKTGKIPMPSYSERWFQLPIGGHAITIVGYRDDIQKFIVRNSWGEGWGVGGYGTIPYEYLTTGSLADDFWTVRAIECE